MRLLEGRGQIRDSAGNRTGCQYVIRFRQELEEIGAVGGPDELEIRSTSVGGLVLTLDDPRVLNEESEFILELEDGRELTIAARFDDDGPQRPVIFEGLSGAARPRPRG